MGRNYGKKYAGGQTTTQPVDTGGNPLSEWEEIELKRQAAVEYATDVIAVSPEGVVTGAKISAITLKRNPLMGSTYLTGMVAMIVVIPATILFAIRGMMFPAQIAETAPMHHRAGNAVGRTMNAAWSLTKPGVAAMEVQLRQQEANRYGGATVTQTSNQGFTTSAPGLINISNQQNTLPNTGLSQAEQQAISNFLK